jgi:hypothetical protein
LARAISSPEVFWARFRPSSSGIIRRRAVSSVAISSSALSGLSPAVQKEIDALLSLLRYAPTRIAVAGTIGTAGTPVTAVEIHGIAGKPDKAEGLAVLRDGRALVKERGRSTQWSAGRTGRRSGGG